MTVRQTALLWKTAGEVPAGGQIVEIGSFRGRSAIVLARAASGDVDLVAIDPHAGNDRGPQEIGGYEDEAEQDHAVFLANLELAGVRHRVRHLRRFSRRRPRRRRRPGRPAVHRRRPSVRPGAGRHPGLGAQVKPGTLLIRNSFSSIGVTLAILRALLLGDCFRYLGRSWSMTDYRNEGGLGPRQRLASALRQAVELPWFVRNVVIKVLITVRLGRLTRLLGHDPGVWPY